MTVRITAPDPDTGLMITRDATSAELAEMAAWAPSLAARRAKGHTALFEALVAAEQVATGQVSPGEIASWPVKAAAAAAQLAGSATAGQTAMLQGEAAFTGETLTALATRIADRAAAYTALAAAIAGLRRKHTALIEAATDPEAATQTALADIAATFAALAG